MSQRETEPERQESNRMEQGHGGDSSKQTQGCSQLKVVAVNRIGDTAASNRREWCVCGGGGTFKAPGAARPSECQAV